MLSTWLQALVLGLVQGATEFIPVSSSGHLVLVPYLFGWEPPGLAFDVALHLGTAAAIVLYFRAELAAMVRGFVRPDADPDGRLYRRLGLLIVLATVPVAVVGLAAKDTVEQIFAVPQAAAGLLFGTAAILLAGEGWRSRRTRAAEAQLAAASEDEAQHRVWAGDWVGADAAAARGDEEEHALPLGEDPGDPAGRTLPEIGVREALVVGVAQVLALLPGISRAGTTITAGMFAGMTRQASTRFAFLLALPALVGAGVVSAPDLAEPGIFGPGDIVIGVVAAFVASYLAIRFLVAFVATERLTGFAKYCIAVGVIGLLGFVMLGPVA